MAERRPWLNEPLKQVRARVIEQVERAYLTALLKRTGGRVGDAARQAGIDPRSLHAKMRRYGLRKEQFKSARKDPERAATHKKN